MAASQGSAKARITSNLNKFAPKGIDHSLTIKMHQGGMSNSQIAEVQGCDISNITRTLQRYGCITNVIEDYKANRADILAGLQERLISNITPEDVKKAPLGSKVLAVAQLYDKERLERGLSTSNIDSHVVTAKIEQVKADLDRIHKRRMELQGMKNDNE